MNARVVDTQRAMNEKTAAFKSNESVENNITTTTTTTTTITTTNKENLAALLRKQNKKRRDEYLPPVGLRHLETVSIRRLDLFKALDNNTNSDDDVTVKDVEVFFELRRVLKEKSVVSYVTSSTTTTTATDDDDRDEKNESKESFACRVDLRDRNRFRSYSIGAKDTRSVIDPDFEIFEREQRKFRECLEQRRLTGESSAFFDAEDEHDEDDEAEPVPGLFEFSVFARRRRNGRRQRRKRSKEECYSSSSSSSSSSRSSNSDVEENGENDDVKNKEFLVHKALISFSHLKRATEQMKELSHNKKNVIILHVQSSRRGSTMYYARHIADVRDFENLDVREKLLLEEESHSNFLGGNSVDMDDDIDYDDNDNDDDDDDNDRKIDDGGGIVIPGRTSDAFIVKKKGRTNSFTADERDIENSMTTPKSAGSSSRSPFSSPFRGGLKNDPDDKNVSSSTEASALTTNRNNNNNNNADAAIILNTENTLQNISKAMKTVNREEELQQRKRMKRMLTMKLEEKLREVRLLSQKQQFLVEIEQKIALSNSKAESLKKNLEIGRKQSASLEKLVSLKTESIRTKRDSLVKKRRDLDELKSYVEGPEIDGTLRRTLLALHNRRWQLVRDLAEAFPTKKVVNPSHTNYDKNKSKIARTWAICGLKLDLADRLLGSSSSSADQNNKKQPQQQQQQQQQREKESENPSNNVQLASAQSGRKRIDENNHVNQHQSSISQKAKNNNSTSNNRNEENRSAGNQLLSTLASLFGYEDADDDEEEFLSSEALQRQQQQQQQQLRDGGNSMRKKNANENNDINYSGDYSQFHSSAARDDAEVAAAALGTVCLLVARLSSIFDVPSRYPVAFGSSRSFVGDLKEIKRDDASDANELHGEDFISDSRPGTPNTRGSPSSGAGGVRKKKSSSSSTATVALTKWRRVEFPLFLDDHAKATGDARRFAYGVFLLNKNVQQILDVHGLESRGPRKTLENVARLFAKAKEYKN